MMKNQLLLSAAMLSILPIVFNPNKGWKKDENGNLMLVDGNPVYVDSQGQEMTVQDSTISTLNGESKSHREAKEAAEARLKEFDGIDPTKAKEALKTVGNLDVGSMKTAEEVEKLRMEITREVTDSFSEQIGATTSTSEKLKSENDSLKLDIAFSGSQFIKERVATPPDMFRKTFGENFKTEDGKIVAYDQSGNKIYSKKNMGQLAGFDEAVEIIVGNYPSKDQILREPSHSGSGSNGGGGQRGNGAVVSRADFAKLSPADQATTAAAASKGEVTITD